MNHNKLKEIREKCIEANPEIVELKFGCELKIWVQKDWKKQHPFPDDMELKRAMFVGVEDSQYMVYAEKEKMALRHTKKVFDREYKIIGRPIHLADVLLVIEPIAIKRDLSDLLLKFIIGSDYMWNLKDDNLDNQSEETINFIHSLLT